MINGSALDVVQQEWMKSAACTDPSIDPDWFFPESEHVKDLICKLALKICTECPVRMECLQFAVDEWPVQGIWGGFRNVELKDIIQQVKGKS